MILFSISLIILASWSYLFILDSLRSLRQSCATTLMLSARYFMISCSSFINMFKFCLSKLRWLITSVSFFIESLEIWSEVKTWQIHFIEVWSSLNLASWELPSECVEVVVAPSSSLSSSSNFSLKCESKNLVTMVEIIYTRYWRWACESKNTLFIRNCIISMKAFPEKVFWFASSFYFKIWIPPRL